MAYHLFIERSYPLYDRTRKKKVSEWGMAWYFALTRWKYINELVVVGGRIKNEVLNGNWNRIKHMNILAIHGIKDIRVDYKSQKTEIKKLSDAGINANFKLIAQKHIFNKEIIIKICDWLTQNGYSSNDSF